MTKRRVQVRADGLAHLHPEVASWIELPPEERRRRLVAARSHWFVTYPQAEKALAYIADIMQAPPSPRPLNLLIHGEPAIGKSQIIRRALQIYPPQAQGGSWPILFVEAPPSLTENSLYNALCEALNLPFRATETSETKRYKLIAALQTNQVRIIIIDEFHNLLSRPGRPQRELLASLRHFGNKLGISFIAAGTSEALSAIEADPHVAGRFRCLNMPRWRRDRTFQNMVTSLEPLLPLTFPSRLADARWSAPFGTCAKGSLANWPSCSSMQPLRLSHRSGRLLILSYWKPLGGCRHPDGCAKRAMSFVRSAPNLPASMAPPFPEV